MRPGDEDEDDARYEAAWWQAVWGACGVWPALAAGWAVETAMYLLW